MTLCLSAANLATFHLIREKEEKERRDGVEEMKLLLTPGGHCRAEGLNNL